MFFLFCVCMLMSIVILTQISLYQMSYYINMYLADCIIQSDCNQPCRYNPNRARIVPKIHQISKLHSVYIIETRETNKETFFQSGSRTPQRP